jgi:hypothetical protein
MPTNKPALRTIEQTMFDYVPTYQPIYPLFLGRAQQHEGVVGKNEFRRIATVGDIRQKHITPKDTEMHRISVTEGKKYYKRYFLANQFALSHLQAQEGTQQVINECLDEHQKQMDELILLGEGTSASTMINNGLYWSDDANYTLNSSAEIASSGSGTLVNLHAQIMGQSEIANVLAGKKVLVVYGGTIEKVNALYSNAVPFIKTLSEALGSNYSIAKLPSAVTPNSASGYMIVNLDQIKVHYTKLPMLDDQGSNDEKKYFWFNFIMGSCMVDCLAANAIIRQPLTYA